MNEIILFILGLSTLVFVLDSVGFLPNFITKYLHRNRLSRTIEALKYLGININEEKKEFKKCKSTAQLKTLENKLKDITINKKVEIGERQRGIIFPNYIDLMGMTSNKEYAIDYAMELQKYSERNPEIIKNVDFIVSSKLGSPILGYEFANLQEIKLPFVLHSYNEEKFRLSSGKKDKRSKFDFGCKKKYKKFKKALIIDDSTTGGRKVAQLIDDLKEYGYEVNDCLVVFAPEGKDAVQKLHNKNVTLHSIIQTPINKGK